MGAKRTILGEIRRRRVVRPRDLARIGLGPAGLARLVAAGEVVQLGRGLYALPDADLGEKEAVLLAAARVPRAVFCLLSALRLHDLTTQNPSEVWITIPHKARAPILDYPPLRVVRASDALYRVGIVEQRIHGMTIRVYSPAKTVADCFKFRSLVGQHVAVEALRDCWRRRMASMDELWEYAKLLRIGAIMRPYLETLG